MTQVKLNTIVHGLSIIAGVFGIIIANAVTLGIPAVIVSALTVGIIVLMYVANQLPGLGSNSTLAAVEAGAIDSTSLYTTKL